MARFSWYGKLCVEPKDDLSQMSRTWRLFILNSTWEFASLPLAADDLYFDFEMSNH